MRARFETKLLEQKAKDASLSSTPMTDPSEMSKSLIKIQTLLIAKKATFIRDSDRTGTANEEVFLHNIGSIINGMKFRVMRKRYIFIVPIGKEEVTFELG